IKMSKLFIEVLNMSLMASYVIIFVMLIRIPLKKAPKVVSYALWSVVGFRLIIPFSFESSLSIIPKSLNMAPIPKDIVYQQNPQIISGIRGVDTFINQSLPRTAIGASVNPLQIYTEIMAYVWILGIILLLTYGIVSVVILNNNLKGARLLEDNIYIAENLKTPFVLGFMKPKIYLPFSLKNDEKNYILLHEQTHIKRKDHIVKILGFLILSIHWFNPLVWLAFILMGADMELSCDERVLKEMNKDIKKSYANSLLSLAAGRHMLNASPLAFGEGNVKGRIKNVMNYKKPKFWIVIISVVVLFLAGISLASNPINNSNSNQFTKKEIADAHAVVEEYFTAIKNKDEDLIIKTMTADHSKPNVVLYGDEIRTLLSVKYNEDDTEIENYIDFGRGATNGSKKENVIAFKVDFNIKYPESSIKSPWNEGDYTNWNVILIRENNKYPWLIDDQGY
ncbi:MAG: DUF4829 domain-containing protein, partial [Clostridium sp.]|nr:DUF4829 domain-containing protein [Clostridium sp.]